MSDRRGPAKPATCGAAAPLSPAPNVVLGAGPLNGPSRERLTEPEQTRADLVWACAMIGGVVVVFVLLESARGLGVPLFLAAAASYLLGPLANRLESMKSGRTTAVATLFLAAFLVLAGAMLYLVPTLADEGAKLPRFFQKSLERTIPFLDRSLPGLHLTSSTSRLTAELIQRLTAATDQIVPFLLQALGSTAEVLVGLLGLLVVPVIAFHFLRDSHRYLERARMLLPEKYRAHLGGRFAEVDRVLGAFVRGQLTVGAILACIYGIGLSLSEIDLALGIALIAGFGNLVPYAGTAVGAVLATMSLLISFHAPWQIAVVVGTFAVAQLLEPTVITPRVVGSRVGLSPVMVILAVLGFGELFGFVGVLLAVPTTAVLMVVIKVLLQIYRRSELYTQT